MTREGLSHGHVLVVSGGFEAVPGIRALVDAGFDVTVLDGDPDAPGFQLTPRRIVSSTYDAERAATLAGRLDEVAPIDGVLSIAADVPLTVATIQDRLALPGQTVEDARIATDKVAMKQRFEETGVPTSWFREVESLSELERIVGNSEEFLIKPVDSRGARGVQRLLAGGNRRAAFHHARDVSPTKRVMLERFVHGPQLSTESLVDGDRVATLAISDRNYEHLDRFAPYVIENGGLLPARRYDEVADAIDELVLRTARALGVERGVVKGDVVWTVEGPVMIEAAPRVSGGWLATDQVPLATGESLIVHAARLARGDRLPKRLTRPTFAQAVCVRYFFPPSGRINSIEGVDELREEPWVQRLELFVEPGERVPDVTDHTKRAGLVLVTGEDREQALERALKSVERVRFVVEPC